MHTTQSKHKGLMEKYNLLTSKAQILFIYIYNISTPIRPSRKKQFQNIFLRLAYRAKSKLPFQKINEQLFDSRKAV